MWFDKKKLTQADCDEAFATGHSVGYYEGVEDGRSLAKNEVEVQVSLITQQAQDAIEKAYADGFADGITAGRAEGDLL